MPTDVQFNGYPHAKDGHGYAAHTASIAPPPRERTITDNAGNEQTETVIGWQVGDVVTFDADLAAQNGYDPANDGADFAELFVTAENIGYETADYPPFALVSSAPPDSTVTETTITTADAGKETE